MKRRAAESRLHARTGLVALVVLGLVLAACEASPTPSASAGESVIPFSGVTYPRDAPADCAYGGEIAQIKAVDRLTVRFSLCYPDAAFLAKVARPNNAIHDSDWLARYGPNERLRAHANGTGPYLLADDATAVAGELSLGRFDGYWGDPAIASRVGVTWEADASTRLGALRSGGVDGIADPSPDAFPVLLGDTGFQLQRAEALSTLAIGMSNTYQPFDSLAIRRALAMGIDRQRIVDDLFPDGSSAADFFAPCSLELACVGDRWYGRDVTAARAVLADPGFPSRLTTHIYFPDEPSCGLPDPALVAEELKAQLQDDLEIEADLQPQPAASFRQNLSAGLLDGLWVMEFCTDSPDVGGFLDPSFNDPASQQFGTLDPSISAPLRAGDAAADPEARQAAYERANDALRDQVPVIPIAHGTSATAWKRDVTGALASPLHAEPFARMNPGGRSTLTWLQGAEPSTFYCADATDPDADRICQSVFESLYGFAPGTAALTPSLAESCEPNADATVWTCHLRDGVTFHDGSALDANDVVASFAAQWDYEQPMHAGRTGAFARWVEEFGPFLNVPSGP